LAFWRSLRLLFTAGTSHVVFGVVLLTALFGQNITEYAFFRATLLWSLFVAFFAYFGQELAASRTSRPRMAVTADLAVRPLSAAGAMPNR
jgi:hypothetical protein